MVKTKEIAERFADQPLANGKTLLKLIDEYNFIRHTIQKPV
ncbi:MAG TPA: hypothetical protein VGN42_22250 [Pirellulales bacterium]|jgi:hypothetical protein|nr:hypothetical protein [Pirellulales bacterium]